MSYIRIAGRWRGTSLLLLLQSLLNVRKYAANFHCFAIDPQPQCPPILACLRLRPVPQKNTQSYWIGGREHLSGTHYMDVVGHDDDGGLKVTDPQRLTTST